MSSMSYLAYELLPYCHAMQSEGSYGSATVLVRQQRVTLPMGAWVGDQESTVNDSAANPCPGAPGTATAT